MLYTCSDCGETRTEKIAMLTDRDLPDAQISALNKSWNVFNSGAAAVNGYAASTAEITFADGESGVAHAEYLVTSRSYADVTALPDMGWVSMDPSLGKGSVALAMDSSQYIYVRVTDNQGNTTIINSGDLIISKNTGSTGDESINAGAGGSGSSSSGSGSAAATASNSSTSGGAAQTGDESGFFFWIMLLGLAGTAAAAAARKYRKV
jgi:hypothetical protein